MKRNSRFFVPGVAAFALMMALVLPGCDTDPGNEDDSTIYFETNLGINWDRTEYTNDVRFSDPTGRYLTKTQEAAIRQLTIDDLTITPLATSKGGDRTLTLENGYRDEQYYDANGFLDMGRDIWFSAKLIRSALPSGASSSMDGTRETSTLSIAPKGGCTFEPDPNVGEFADKVQW